MACGEHFISDCIAGLTFGKMAVCLSGYVTDPNFVIVVLLVSLYMWPDCRKIVPCVLTVVIAPEYKYNWIVAILVLLIKVPVNRIFGE